MVMIKLVCAMVRKIRLLGKRDSRATRTVYSKCCVGYGDVGVGYFRDRYIVRSTREELYIAQHSGIRERCW